MIGLLIVLTLQFVHVECPPEWIDNPPCFRGEMIDKKRVFRTSLYSCRDGETLWIESRHKGKLVRMIFKDEIDYNRMMEAWGLRRD